MTPHINSTAGLTLGSLCHHMTIATFAIFKLTVYAEGFFLSSQDVDSIRVEDFFLFVT